ncbi:PQQ-dependent sugar dehydrogenase [Melioribacter sp. OK-6-Me]|uniref:PQQ-dependent sugar dehydrogenase n=1 Tax=unclassified Melioribacter TaxID=2627329 RepID=UPI003EDAFBDB
MKKWLYLFTVVLFLLGCGQNKAQLKIELAFPNIEVDYPVDIQNAGDGSDRIFVVSQPGIIYSFENKKDANSPKIFLDISRKVLFGGEQGLLGLAFHPDFETNGEFFVNYTTDNPRRTVISRFKTNDARTEAITSSEEILLEILQPYSNHNGGQVLFCNDGYLYISTGDGGSAGDPQNNAQSLKSLLGKILRIDVDRKDDGKNYSIPAENPFVNNPDARGEIYAYGLRNVWRFSYDPITNLLWAADVGQNKWEEIDLIEKGKNYGWRIMEGFHCYNPSTNCDTSGLTTPIWEYGHNEQGGWSITGGFVYRGSDAEELIGKYVYADFVSGNIWSLEFNNGAVKNELLFDTDYAISTFGVDEKNELYFANYTNGRIYKFTGSPVSVGKNRIPAEIQISQNYPNPFNSSTIIDYYLDSGSYISLKLYDLAGKEVSHLIDEYKSEGWHRYHFDTRDLKVKLASGVYFYKFTTSRQQNGIVRKIVFLK